jgi:reverse gyrase
MTTFYLTRPPSLNAHALSAPVGSGKTKAATCYMARTDTAQQNFVYVAPTIALIKQMDANLRRALAAAVGPVVRNVNLIHAENTDGSAREDAIRALIEVRGNEGQVVLLTTSTFLHIISTISRPELWHVILDEAFSPVDFTEFGLGKDIRDGWDYFRELFDVDAEQAHRMRPAKSS